MSYSNSNISSLCETNAALIKLYIVGLLFSTYPPLIVSVGGTEVLRPDWLLSIPLLLFGVLVYSRFTLTRAIIALFTFTFVVFLSGVINSSISDGGFLTVFLQLGYSVILFTTVASFRPSTDEIREIFRFLLLLILIFSLYGVYQALALNTPIPMISLSGYTEANAFQYHNYNRPISIFSEPSTLANTALMGAAVLLPAVTKKEPVFFSLDVQRTILGVFILCLVLSSSLSGYITGGISFFILMLFPDFRSLLRWMIIGTILGTILVVVGGAFGINIFELMITRLLSIVRLVIDGSATGGGSVNIRTARWIAAIRAWIENPIFGTSPGQFPIWVRANDPSVPFDVRKPLTKIHGAWLQVPALTGGVGFLVFTSGWLYVIRDYLSTLGKISPKERPLILSGVALTITQLVAWTFDLSFINTFRWGFMGIAYGYVVKSRTENQ